ncbi:GNAT family N-acetyltransferase [Helicovermis profundi]|uniref:N-acetyltransferase domain-containing protein n=1 Tax=Helicovermis profundi TaxID=3065157 RepID=A0AAU9EB89_9FIRM|nr:hypothetical protein HLPR_15180 [Clostridia bacterium S502]
MIKYVNSKENIEKYEYNGFFVGWPKPPSGKMLKKILLNSNYTWLAIDDKEQRVVGFIYAITDGFISGYIPLLEVLPDYQGQGIGSKLVNLMLESLEKLYMIDLICDKDKISFYERFDMRENTGMSIRNYSNQSGE